MFDVSHLGTVRLSDGEAADRVQNTLTNDLGKLSPGSAIYLVEYRRGVLDDIIVWWHHSGVIDVMPNASNTASVRSTLGGDDITTQRGHAVQDQLRKGRCRGVPKFRQWAVSGLVSGRCWCRCGHGYGDGLEMRPSGDAVAGTLAEPGNPQGSVPVTHFASRRASRYWSRTRARHYTVAGRPGLGCCV